VRLFVGVPCPLVGRKAGDIDFFVVVLAEGPRTRDLGGKASATDMGTAIAERVAKR